jgi:hypothetical protein
MGDDANQFVNVLTPKVPMHFLTLAFALSYQ